MDKEFDTINQMYLSQQFVDDSEEKHQMYNDPSTNPVLYKK